jgi:hypothetical protein
MDPVKIGGLYRNDTTPRAASDDVYKALDRGDVMSPQLEKEPHRYV